LSWGGLGWGWVGWGFFLEGLEDHLGRGVLLFGVGSSPRSMGGGLRKGGDDFGGRKGRWWSFFLRFRLFFGGLRCCAGGWGAEVEGSCG